MDEDQIFTAEAIRDTVNHNSTVSITGEFIAKNILVYNGLNQLITVQLQGSRDKTIWLNMGATWDVAISTNKFKTVSDYFPFYRLQAICGTSPTTGVLDAWILKTKG